MELDAPVKLTDKQGNSMELPLVNLLRLTLVKMQPLMQEFFKENATGTMKDFNKWMSDKLGMTGTSVLL